MLTGFPFPFLLLAVLNVRIMNELIKVTEKDGKQLVSARDLYRKLELADGQFARWARTNIVENPYAIENEDWVGFDIYVEGNSTKDYAIVLSFAKKIAMMSKTEEGNKVRDYFLECEKKSQRYIPKTYSEALLLAARQAEQIECQQKLIEEQKPKAEFYDDVVDSKDAIDMAKVAKTLNMGIGRNNLFQFLRDKKVLMQNNTPYQYYVDNQWFRCVESRYMKPNGDICINIKTVVLQKGLDGIRKLLKEK